MSKNVLWFSYSQIDSYLRCERQWMYRYVDGWKPEESGRGMQLGNLMHAALGLWWRGVPVNDIIPALYQSGVDEVSDQAEMWDDFEWLMRRYDETYRDQHKSVEIVEQEQFRRVLLPDPYAHLRHEMPHLSRFGLIFKVDMLVRHPGYKGLVLFEYKTMKDWGREDLLEIDPQVSTYMWGLQQLGYNLSIGYFDAIKTYRWKLPKNGKERKPHESFRRLMVDRDGPQLQTFANNTLTICRKMHAARSNKLFSVNVIKDCAWCDYFAPCYEHLIGAPNSEASILEESYTRRDRRPAAGVEQASDEAVLEPPH